MRKKIFILIILPIIALTVIGLYILNPDMLKEVDAGSYINGENLLTSIIIIIGIGMLMGFLWVLYSKRIIAEGYKKAKGALGKHDIQPIIKSELAARVFIHEFGVENWAHETEGKKLHVAAQRVIAPTSDTPYIYFVFTTENISIDMKNKWEDIDEHKRWVIFVDRKTNECSFDPNIGSHEDALKYMRELMSDALPMELKESMENKMMKSMMSEFAGEKVREVARKPGKREVEKSEAPAPTEE